MGTNERFTSADVMTRDMLEDHLKQLEPHQDLIQKVSDDIKNLNLGDRRPAYHYGFLALLSSYGLLMESYRGMIRQIDTFELQSKQRRLPFETAEESDDYAHPV